jgi:hypothetical protein
MSNACVSCRAPKTPRACGLCQGAVCKDCARFLDAEAFSFRSSLPPELAHSYYCPACHDEQVAPAQESYDATMEQAKGVYVFFTTQKRRPHPIKKAIRKVQVASCVDRDQTILRLAFQAAEQGHNGLLDTEVTSRKVRNAGYQKSDWTGSGLPITVDPAKVEREALLEG